MSGDTERLLEAKIPGEDTGIEIKHTICDICSPAAHCGVDAYVKDGRILKIEGTPGFIPNQGTLCAKGAVGRQYVCREDRIKYPMKRTGQRGSGQFERISWDEAFKITAEKLNESKAAYGPEATIFLCGYTKWFRPFFHRLAYSFGSPNYITESSTCYRAGLIAHNCIFGSMCMPDAAGARLIVLWGSDAFNGNAHQGRNLLNLKEQGVKFILIDPRSGPMADQLADIYLRPRLGTDGFLAHAMANYMIENNLYDKDFVDRYVYGFEEYGEMVSHYSLEEAEKVCGVPKEQIAEVARIFAETDPSVIMMGNGIAHRTNGFNNLRAILSISAICGRFDRPGTLMPGTGPMTFCYSPCGFVPKELQFIAEKKTSEPPHKVGWDKYPLFVDILDEGQGMELARQIESGKPYPIKTAFLAGVNNRMYPDTERFRKALGKLDFIAASDLFWTEACEMADIVFPVASSFERSEVKFYINRFMIYTSPAIEPIGESRDDMAIFSGLARALDLDDDLLKAGYDACARYMVEEGAGIEDWEAFKAGNKQVPIPAARPYEWGTVLKRGMRTPTGKIELYSETIAAYNRPELNPLPVYYENLDAADPQEYDMTMCSGTRIPAAIHSRLHECPWARSLRPEPSVDINPQDAERLRIEQGDMIRISTPTSSIKAGANITLTANVGEVHMFHGYKEANINEIIDSEVLDPYSGYPPFKQFRCRIEKAD